ncbi:MAG TPA: CAP domain-containing protein [Planktothrix sp.]|jgi:uncharacterized protein YkwD
MKWREILIGAASLCLISTGRLAIAKETPDEQLMSASEARQFIMDMVNEERRSMGLRPVSTDAVAARAGQRHADEMAERVYMAHWDLLGKKPWERYNQVGGTASVAENVAYVGTQMPDQPTPQALPLVSPPMFPRKDLAAMEEAMFTERAPNDGHRKNILDPHHTGLGIGLAVSAQGGWSRVTLDEEFTDNYGRFPPITSSLQKGLEVSGSLDPHVSIDNVLLEYEPTPHAMLPAQLNKTHSYDWPTTTLSQAWTPGFHTDAPLKVIKAGGRQKFDTTLPAMAYAQPGIYYVVIWAHKDSLPDDKFVASVRTISRGPRASMPILPKVSPAIVLATQPKDQTSPSSQQQQHATATGAPDMKTLFFHPELLGSKSVPATVDRAGPPELSKLFFQPAAAAETLPVKLPTPRKHGADASDLFFDPTGANAGKGQAPVSDKKPKADVRDLFFHP